MVEFLDRIEHLAVSFWGAIGTALGGAVIWAVRTIFTNKKVAEAAQASVVELRTEVERRDREREKDRALMQRIEDRLDQDVRTLQEDVKKLLQR